MITQIITPSEDIRPYIRRYVYLKAEGSTDTMAPPSDDPHFENGLHVQTIFPDWGNMVLVRGVRVRIDNKDTSESFAIGAHTKSRSITTLTGWMEALFIEFEPGSLNIISYPDIWAEKVVTASEASNQVLAQCDMIFKEGEDITSIVQQIELMIRDGIEDREKQRDENVRKAIEQCDKRLGQISVAEMADAACLSGRQFNRVFTKLIGMSPKEFIRIRRFHLTLQELQQTQQKPDLGEIALRHGYYDLSHMASEFKAIGCLTPSQFRQLGIPISSDFSVFFG